MIASLQGHQFLVRSLFGYLPIVHHHDAVGILHGGQSVSYHEDGLAVSEVCQSLSDKMLVLRVGKGGSLIKHHDGCIFQNGTRKDDALLFTTGEVSALRSNDRIQTLGQSVDDFTALREVYRPVYLFCRCFGITIA